MKRAYPTPDSNFSSKRRKITKKAKYKPPALSRPQFLRKIGRKITATGKVVKVAKKKTQSYSAPGVYTGKFKTNKRNVVSAKSSYLSRGFHKTNEQWGLITSQDAVYLSHSTGCINQIADVVLGCLFRKVLNKAGFKISNLFRELPVTDPVSGSNVNEDSSGLRFVYTVADPIDKNTATLVYDTINGQDFNNVVSGFNSMRNHLIDYMRAENASQIERYAPFKFAVYKLDQGYTSILGERAFWRLAAEVYLADLSIDLKCVSSLTVQNRTKSEAGSNDTDRLDTQPLSGYFYEFKHADPRVKAPSILRDGASLQNNVFNQMHCRGLNLIRGNEFVSANEPIDPKYFSNVAKCTKLVLQPGEMKKISFTHSFKGKFTTVIKNLRMSHYNSANDSFSGLRGKCQMLSFEETMRTSTTYPVSISYQRNVGYGCIMNYKFHDTPLEDTFVITQVDNLEA